MGVNMVSEIDKLVKSLQKDYGSLRIANSENEKFEFISTGIRSLDLALGGGVVWGVVVENIGLSQSGKTTIMQKLLANAQKEYDVVGIWIDREKSWYSDRAEQLGIDTKKVIVVDPTDTPSIIQVESLIKDIISSLDKETYKFIAIDSISAFCDPLALDKTDMGQRAKELHRFFRKIIPIIDSKTIINVSNHITFKPGILFGNPKTTSGGESVRYYSTFRIEFTELRNIIDETKGGRKIGNWIKATIIKTRRGPNNRSIVFPHYFDEGILYNGGYTRTLVDNNYIQPKNKSEFALFKQHTVKYKDKQLSEFDLENKLDEFPELLFDRWPDWYNDNSSDK